MPCRQCPTGEPCRLNSSAIRMEGCKSILPIPAVVCRRNKWNIFSNHFRRPPVARDWDYQLSIKSFATMVVQSTCAVVKVRGLLSRLNYQLAKACKPDYELCSLYLVLCTLYLTL